MSFSTEADSYYSTVAESVYLTVADSFYSTEADSSYLAVADSVYLTEASSHHLRRLHLAGLPWALTCPLESPLALEIRRRLLAQQCGTAAGASLQGAIAVAAGAVNAMSAETASDDNAATAALAANVFEAAVPVFELAEPVFESTAFVFEAAAPVIEATAPVFESAAPGFESAANDDANRSESTTSSDDFLTGFATDILTGLAHGLDVQVAHGPDMQVANELDVQVEKMNATSTAQ